MLPWKIKAPPRPYFELFSDPHLEQGSAGTRGQITAENNNPHSNHLVFILGQAEH